MLSFLNFTACNGVFYQPDPRIYSRLPNEWNTQDHWIPVGKEQKIHSWYVPPDPMEKYQGLVIQFHGNAQNLTSHILSLLWLRQYGYGVLSFDYRGYGQSSALSPTPQSTAQDGAAVITYAAQNFKGPVILWGQSLGGAIVPASVFLAKKSSQSCACWVLDSTFPSYRVLAQRKLSQFWLTWPLQWPLSYLVSDDFSPLDFKSTSADLFKTPTLIIHHKEDPVVPYDQGVLYESLMVKSHLLTLEGNSHITILDFMRQPILDFLQRSCLGGVL